MSKKDTFIQERLEKLYDVDTTVVSLLDNLSSIYSTVQQGKTYQESADILAAREKFVNQTKEMYAAISHIAINLRKEIKIMDDNTGKCENKDGIMILPINIIQKNTKLNQMKLNEEFKELDKLLETPESATSDVKEEDSIDESQTGSQEEEAPKKELNQATDTPDKEDDSATNKSAVGNYETGTVDNNDTSTGDAMIID